MESLSYVVLSFLHGLIEDHAGEEFAKPLSPSKCDPPISSDAKSLVDTMRQADITNIRSNCKNIRGQLEVSVNSVMAQLNKYPERRGLFIVFEGPDRCGKTTQSKLLYEKLKNSGKKIKLLNFPDRTTPSGLLIDHFLKSKGLGVPIDKIPIVSHLLFAYNRWERMNSMFHDLRDGINLVCDRYSFSGVVYSEQAQGLDPSRTGVVECGLLRPDIVIQPMVSAEILKTRPGFGEELYEKQDLQNKIFDHFYRYHTFSWWQAVDGNKSIEEVRRLVIDKVVNFKTPTKGCIKLLSIRDLK